MNPGEYIGKDGRLYCWEWLDDGDGTPGYHLAGYDRRRMNTDRFYPAHIPPADWPAAKAALDALIEAESEGWVEWIWAGGMCRASADGSRVQMWDYCLEKWVDATESRTGAAYRKGRGVAEAEQAELRDAVRELVEAVNIYDRYLKRHGSGSRSDLIIAAKKVEAKL